MTLFNKIQFTVEIIAMENSPQMRSLFFQCCNSDPIKCMCLEGTLTALVLTEESIVIGVSQGCLESSMYCK